MRVPAVRSPHVVQVSLDASLIDPMGDPEGLERQRRYARLLAERAGPASAMTIVVLHNHRTAVGCQEPGLKVVPIRGGALAPFRLSQALRALQRERRIDVITTQRVVKEAWTALAFAHRRGIPVLGQVHGDLLAQGALRSGFLGGLQRWLLRSRLRGFVGLRVVSRRIADQLAGRDAPPMVVLPVPVWDPAPDAAPSSGGPPVLLYVGRFAPEKNLGAWLAVGQRVAREIPDLRLLMVGDGAERATLLAELARSGLADRAELPGWVPHGKLGPVYARTSVLLVTSDHEGFGRVMLEAGLHGVPVVATATAGALEVVIHEQTGYVLSPGDLDGMARAVVRLIRETALARRMGDRARRELAERFDPDRLATAWVDLLIAVAQGRPIDPSRALCGS